MDPLLGFQICRNDFGRLSKGKWHRIDADLTKVYQEISHQHTAYFHQKGMYLLYVGSIFLCDAFSIVFEEGPQGFLTVGNGMLGPELPNGM